MTVLSSAEALTKHSVAYQAEEAAAEAPHSHIVAVVARPIAAAVEGERRSLRTVVAGAADIRSHPVAAAYARSVSVCPANLSSRNSRGAVVLLGWIALWGAVLLRRRSAIVVVVVLPREGHCGLCKAKECCQDLGRMIERAWSSRGKKSTGSRSDAGDVGASEPAAIEKS
jgi:hypothetical protein